MKKEVIYKVLSIVITLFLCMFILFCNFSAAKDPTNIDTVMGWEYDSDIKGKTENVVGTIITVMRYIGFGIAIIMLMYVAIKYMSASPDGKAEFKKSATGYIVGAVILFATSGILTVIQNFATKNLNK